MFMRATSLARDIAGLAAAVSGMGREAAAKSSGSDQLELELAASAFLRHDGIGVEKWSDSDVDEVTVGGIVGDRDAHGSTSCRSVVCAEASALLGVTGVLAESPAMSSHRSKASVNSFVSSSRGSEVD